MKALKFILPILIIVLLALASVFLVEDYQGRLQDAGAVVEEHKTDLLTYSAEVSRLNTELNQRDIDAKRLGAELTTALEANSWTYGLKPDEYKPEVRT